MQCTAEKAVQTFQMLDNIEIFYSLLGPPKSKMGGQGPSNYRCLYYILLVSLLMMFCCHEY